MITEDGIKTIRESLRKEARERGLPLVFSVGNFYGRTVSIAFGPRYTRDMAARLVDALVSCGLVRPDGVLWLPEYLEATGGEFRCGDERILLADLAAPRMYYATAEEAEEWRRENIIEILPSWRAGAREVFLPLRHRFYDAIESGSKMVECRRYCSTWVRRLLGPPVERLRFQRGYAKGARQMRWTVSRIELADADGVRRYSPRTLPDFPEPEWILLNLGRRVD